MFLCYVVDSRFEVVIMLFHSAVVSAATMASFLKLDALPPAHARTLVEQYVAAVDAASSKLSAVSKIIDLSLINLTAMLDIAVD